LRPRSASGATLAGVAKVDFFYYRTG